MHAFSYALGDRAQCVGPKHNEERTSAYESDFTAREPERGVCSAQKCLLSQYRTPELRLQMRRVHGKRWQSLIRSGGCLGQFFHFQGMA